MADQPTGDNKTIKTEGEAQDREHNESRAPEIGQGHERDHARDNANNAEAVGGYTPRNIIRKICRSPQTVLNAILILFTGGVMYATFQYSDTAKKAERPWVGIQTVGQASPIIIQGNFTLSADAPVNIAVGFANYGQSPAIHGALYFRAMLGGHAPGSAAKWDDDIAPHISDCHQKVDAQAGTPV